MKLVELGALKPKPAKSGARLQSIWVKVWLIDCPVSVIVLLRFAAKSFADCWLAITPAGIDIMIAIEKPNAITTSSARIFLLEMFLIALLIIPTFNTC